jgi:hypothetical protein
LKRTFDYETFILSISLQGIKGKPFIVAFKCIASWGGAWGARWQENLRDQMSVLPWSKW